MMEGSEKDFTKLPKIVLGLCYSIQTSKLYSSSRGVELCPLTGNEMLPKYSAIFAVSVREKNSSVKLDLHPDAFYKINVILGL